MKKVIVAVLTILFVGGIYVLLSGNGESHIFAPQPFATNGVTYESEQAYWQWYTNYYVNYDGTELNEPVPDISKTIRSDEEVQRDVEYLESLIFSRYDSKLYILTDEGYKLGIPYSLADLTNIVALNENVLKPAVEDLRAQFPGLVEYLRSGDLDYRYFALPPGQQSLINLGFSGPSTSYNRMAFVASWLSFNAQESNFIERQSIPRTILTNEAQVLALEPLVTVVTNIYDGYGEQPSIKTIYSYNPNPQGLVPENDQYFYLPTWGVFHLTNLEVYNDEIEQWREDPEFVKVEEYVSHSVDLRFWVFQHNINGQSAWDRATRKRAREIERRSLTRTAVRYLKQDNRQGEYLRYLLEDTRFGDGLHWSPNTYTN